MAEHNVFTDLRGLHNHGRGEKEKVAVKPQVAGKGEYLGSIMFNSSRTYREPRSMLSTRVTWSNYMYMNSRMVTVDFGDNYINEKDCCSKRYRPLAGGQPALG